MNGEINLLNAIYQNSKMGEETMRTLLKNVDDTHLKQDMRTQMEGYTSLSGKAQNEILKRNALPEDNGTLTKASANIGITLNTLKDSSVPHIAGMVIQGSTMGIVDTTEKLHKYKDASSPVQKLAKEVVKFEQNNIERLKEYL